MTGKIFITRDFRRSAAEGAGLMARSGGVLVMFSQTFSYAAAQPGGGAALTAAGIALFGLGHAVVAKCNHGHQRRDFRTGGFLAGMFAAAALTLGTVAAVSKEPPPPPSPSCAPAPPDNSHPAVYAVPSGAQSCPLP